jgi:hypothetical protein
MSLVLTSCNKPPVVQPDPDQGNTGGNGGGDTNKDPVDEEFNLPYADGTTLRMATGYNNAKTGLFFDKNQNTV